MNTASSCAFVAAILFVSLGFAKEKPATQFFPSGVFSEGTVEDEYWATRYSEYLNALHEPSLSQISKSSPTQSYRFLWLRTFHSPVSVRVHVSSSGEATITTKVTSGAGGYSPGHLISNRTRKLTRQETDSFLKLIESSGFWNLGLAKEPRGGVDGAQWVVEGVASSRYHIIYRWSPKEGAVREIGLALIDLGHVTVAPKETY